MTKLGMFTPANTLLRECGWLSVSQLVFFHSVVLLYKTRIEKKPRFLFDMAEPVANRRYDTRGSNLRNLKAVGHQIPSCKVNWNSFRWRSVRFWNQLPTELKELKNITKFRSQLKIWIRDNVEIV